MSDKQIEAATGISRNIITKWRQKNNLKGNKPYVYSNSEHRIHLSDDVLRGFVARGMTIREIAEETGWSGRTISRRLTQAGLKGNKRDYNFSPLTELSMCSSCIHAYGDDCLGTPMGERIWVTEVECIEAQTHPESEPYEIYKVKACQRYKHGRRKPHIIDKNAAYRLMAAILKKDCMPDTEIEKIWITVKAKEVEYVNGGAE